MADHLLAAVPALATVDLDRAQLDRSDLPTPLAYPAVFLDLEDAPWTDLAAGIQTSRATLRLTVALALDSLATDGSTERSTAVAQLELPQLIHQALQHYQGPGFGPLSRVSYRRDRPQHPQAYCLTVTYATQLLDQAAAPDYRPISNVELQPQLASRPLPLPEAEPYVLPQ
ncbi:hypothetical protein B0919_16685 [Hymenobacter sp. CRA2]|nr:hypothetical protein B0919_16685 [Hymenobacter sp. CRA2]